MKKQSEQDIQNAVNEYSKKTDSELMQELDGCNIEKSEFDSFAEMIAPMLSDEQRKKLKEIGKELGFNR